MNEKDKIAFEHNKRVLDAHSRPESEDAFYKLFSHDIRGDPMVFSSPKRAPSFVTPLNPPSKPSSTALRSEDELECIELDDVQNSPRVLESHSILFDNFVDEDSEIQFPLGSQRRTRFLEDGKSCDEVLPFSVDAEFDYNIPANKLSKKTDLFAE